MNRFDDVCDIEDNEDYEQTFIIKKSSVINQLRNFIGLTSEEEKNINIVGVSANPFEKGLEYWFQNKEKYNELSHIEDLQKLTNSILLDSKKELLKDQSISVLKDIILKETQQAITHFDVLVDGMESRKEALNDISRDLKNTKNSLNQKRTDFRAELLNKIDGLLLQLNGTDPTTLGDFCIKEIGEEGSTFEAYIQNLVESYSDSSNALLENVTNSIKHELDFRESLVDKNIKDMVTTGMKSVSSIGVKAMRTTILNSRNVLRTGLKSVGVDAAMKFKPWGAVKLAKNISGAIAIAGFLIEAWDMWKTHKQAKETDKAKTKIKDYMNGYKSHILEMIKDDDTFIKNFAPDYFQIKKTKDQIEEDVEYYAKQKSNFSEWFKKSKDIVDIEFETVS